MSLETSRAIMFVVAAATASEASLTPATAAQDVRTEADKALRQAISEGDLEAARASLAAGANPSARSEEGVTPLWGALTMERGEIAVVLIEAGAEVDALDPRGQATPLMYAAGSGKPQLVKKLLAAGAAIDVQGKDGITALSLAEGMGQNEIAQILRAAGASSELGQKAAFLLAIMAGNTPKVRELVEAGVDVNEPAGDFEETPLISAVRGGHLEIVNVLIEAGCELEALDRLEKTALRTAVEGESVEIAQALLAAGANVKAPSERIGPMLLSATTSPQAASMVPLLVRAGVDVDEQDEHGWTALMLAAGNAEREAAGALIEAGADLNLRNSNGDTALAVALAPDENEHRAARAAEIAMLLRAAGVKK